LWSKEKTTELIASAASLCASSADKPITLGNAMPMLIQNSKDGRQAMATLPIAPNVKHVLKKLLDAII
jgi:hypothetical protein